MKGQLPNSTRWSGKDRYETNIAINKQSNIDTKNIYVATGTNYADALTGAVLAAKNNSSILLVHQRVPDVVANFITSKKLSNLSIFGGKGAVSDKVAKDLEKLVK
ncbi:cell wall-binding repeat-containing protein [Oceanobacillus alkalisoli]|uniref:cell wall-binding repeat-containing protein n=1 Tax=Oceanobacillus alkalisoli TaxID=2925113 RepID=UPI001F11B5FA|nr:cell wall-binding repeat-containing protein [Oceanobacillus alkalisoli]MCF3943155.1 cell wall-binding repeat-containing protein [Oceanobacillus alkalisoli]